MKHFTLLLLLAALLCGSSTVSAQRYFEVGLQGGDMPYNGDLSDPGIGFLSDWNTFGGFYLRYRPISRVGLRLNGIFGRIEAENETSVRISQDERAAITRNFRSRIQEFSLAAEFDLFYLGDPEDRFVAPYLMVGIGRTAFEPQSQDDGVYYDLQPLKTEGQGIRTGAYDPAPYALNITTYHVGGGLRAKLGERIVVGGEVSGRLTGTDYLDDISGRRLNYQEVLANTTTQGAFFSNPAVQPGEAPDNLNYSRGGSSDDFYFLINLTVGIRLGGWGGGRGGNGCYSF
ncbi:hypothetical protein LEM8419_00729 [Neolewinella maritima]|uniref:DUF6089 domain-containing protein n=1 Tax=Neolewinella maritima TaxID=1383882 RepID=A0ABN8F3T9_9BACT|nr:DUF6089 family protein [Neolewinella maritima]CAH0999430.1 hypothetical protein LEM8419_00729 [Neolewinella maritima]